MPQSFDIWYVTSRSGILPSLLKVWLCGQNGLILDVTEFTFYLLIETYKISWFETTTSRSLISSSE